MNDITLLDSQPIDDEDEGGTESGTQLKGSLFLIPPELRHDILNKLKENILTGLRSTFGALKIGQRRPNIKPSSQPQAKNPLKKHPLLDLTGADPNVSPNTQDNTDVSSNMEEFQNRLTLRLRHQLQLGAKATKAPPELIRR